jgi:hypothetical protein
MAGRALVLKVDADAHLGLSAHFGVRAIPTFVVIRNGHTARSSGSGWRRAPSCEVAGRGRPTHQLFVALTFAVGSDAGDEGGVGHGQPSRAC